MFTKAFPIFICLLTIGLFSILHACPYERTEEETDPDKLARFLLENVAIDGGAPDRPDRFENSLTREPIVSDSHHIRQALQKIDKERRQPLVELVKPLLEGFASYDACRCLCTSRILTQLSQCPLIEAPIYLKLLRSLAPTPTLASPTHDLLQCIMSQDSLDNTRDFIQLSSPITSHFKKEREHYYILETLSKVDKAKRGPLIKSVLPFLDSFKKDMHRACHVSYTIKYFAELPFGDIPEYLKLLERIVSDPADSDKTVEYLRRLISQGSLEKAHLYVDNKIKEKGIIAQHR